MADFTGLIKDVGAADSSSMGSYEAELTVPWVILHVRESKRGGRQKAAGGTCFLTAQPGTLKEALARSSYSAVNALESGGSPEQHPGWNEPRYLCATSSQSAGCTHCPIIPEREA